MLNLLNYELKEEQQNKSIQITLVKTYGIGKKRSIEACRIAGICKNQKISGIEPNQVEALTKLVSSKRWVIQQELKKKLTKVFENQLAIKSYKGLRKVKGYPARGQRTHTNGKTARKRLKFL